ncbi:hypothetical protein CATMIT_01565, partial [Catenibacterium mitsuokai DSM 15897]
AGIALARHLHGRIVAGFDRGGVQVFVAGDPAQRRQPRAQVGQQRQQRVDLRRGVGLVHRLVARIQPVRIAPGVDQLDPDRTRVVAAHVMGDALVGDVAQHRAVAVDVVVAAVAGARGRIQHALAVLARGGQLWQLGAVDHRQVDRGRIARLQPGLVGQGREGEIQGRHGP